MSSELSTRYSPGIRNRRSMQSKFFASVDMQPISILNYRGVKANVTWK